MCICKKVFCCSLRTTLILINILETFLWTMTVIVSVMSIAAPSIKQRLYMNINNYLFIMHPMKDLVLRYFIPIVTCQHIDYHNSRL